MRKDVEVLERVQRRATRMMEGFERKSYEERLRGSHLTTLETRAVRADILEVFRIMNGLVDVREADFFARDGRRGRGHTYKLFKRRVRLDFAKYSFGNRVWDQWNRLPQEVVSSPSVNTFRKG